MGHFVFRIILLLYNEYVDAGVDMYAGAYMCTDAVVGVDVDEYMYVNDGVYVDVDDDVRVNVDTHVAVV